MHDVGTDKAPYATDVLANGITPNVEGFRVEGGDTKLEVTQHLDNPDAAAQAITSRFGSYIRDLGVDPEDVRALVYLSFMETDQKIDDLKAAGEWIPKTEHPETSYVFTNAYGDVRDFLSREARHQGKTYIALDAPTSEDDDSTEAERFTGNQEPNRPVENQAIKKVLNEKLHSTLENYLRDEVGRLSFLEKAVLQAFLDGKDRATIASELGKSSDSVNNALEGVVVKLRAAFGEDVTQPISIDRTSPGNSNERILQDARASGMTKKQAYFAKYMSDPENRERVNKMSRERQRRIRAERRNRVA